MIDRDLAILYSVKSIRLREQVKRNIKRFPEDFMFQLNKQEVIFMVSQNAIPSMKHLGGHLPYVFTEQGVAMISSILNSERAIEVNIQIIRSFIKLRELLATNKEIRDKIEEMEKKYDKHLKDIFEALRQLIIQDKKPKKQIGFLRN